MMLGKHLHVAVYVGMVPVRCVSDGLDAFRAVGHDGSDEFKPPVGEQRTDIGDALERPRRFAGDAVSADLFDSMVEYSSTQTPQPGRGTSFWIPLRINPA